MDFRRKKVAVIGGGISGVTTATLLQLNGYETCIYTHEQPAFDIEQSNRLPSFASLHAAASILPHSVVTPKAAYWTRVSQEYFRVLAFLARCGVREQTHFEIFEDIAKPPPEYWRSLQNFQQLDEADLLSPQVPRRLRAEATSGWRFDIFFSEAPQYIAFLYNLYAALGGQLVVPAPLAGDKSLMDYLRLDYQFYVNCTGHAAIDFVNDSTLENSVEDIPDQLTFEPLHDQSRAKYLRGHYLRVDIKKLLTDERGRFFSYNYTPSAEVYHHANGDPADVYCYPRSDCWVLGGSRQVHEGPLDPSGRWIGEEIPEQSAELFAGRGSQQIAIPRVIFELNDQLLERVTLGSLSLRKLRAERPDAFVPGVGLRFLRSNSSSSVRLSCSRVRFGTVKYILHNYGHGGAGFTLSWGCALDLLRILDSITCRDSAEVPPRTNLGENREIVKTMLAELTRRLIGENA